MVFEEAHLGLVAGQSECFTSCKIVSGFLDGHFGDNVSLKTKWYTESVRIRGGARCPWNRAGVDYAAEVKSEYTNHGPPVRLGLADFVRGRVHSLVWGPNRYVFQRVGQELGRT